MNARYLTAAVGIPIVLGLVWQGGTVFVVVVAILALLAMRELELVCRRAKVPVAAIVAYPALLFILAVTWQFARAGERLHADAVWIWLVPLAMLAAEYSCSAHAGKFRWFRLRSRNWRWCMSVCSRS